MGIRESMSIEKMILKPYLFISKASWKIDMHVVDEIVDGIARSIYSTGEKSTGAQNANLSKSLLSMALGLVFFIVLGAIYSFAK